MRAGRMRVAVVAVLIGAGLMAGAPGGAAGAAGSTPSGIARLLVGWSGVADAEARATIDAVAAEHAGRVDLVEHVLDFAAVDVPEARAEAALAAFRSATGITRVQRDVPLELHYTPNDPLYYDQWGPPAIGMPRAWDHTRGTHNRKVAVIDTGVAREHVDLGPNYCFEGPNYLHPWGRPWDDHGHGTHVAGTIAAKIDNLQGVAGMGDTCVGGIKVIDGFGGGSNAYLAAGIRWAADNGIHVVNISLGADSPTFAAEDAVEYAWGKGVLIVASAGNDDCTAVGYPAAYPEVIAVAALASPNARASYSDCGPEVEVAAPGSNIWSTDFRGGYSLKSGTSMAAPHTAGVAALLWDLNPSLTNGQLRCLLRETADDLGAAGFDHGYGWGRIDADGALDRMAQPAPLPSWPACGAAPPPTAPRSDDAVYLGGNGLVVECLTRTGGACFDVKAGETIVDVELDDLFVAPVGGSVAFHGAGGVRLDRRDFCGNIDNADIPAGTTEVRVYAGGPHDGLDECGSAARTATMGFIDVAFNRP